VWRTRFIINVRKNVTLLPKGLFYLRNMEISERRVFKRSTEVFFVLYVAVCLFLRCEDQRCTKLWYKITLFWVAVILLVVAWEQKEIKVGLSQLGLFVLKCIKCSTHNMQIVARCHYAEIRETILSCTAVRNSCSVFDNVELVRFCLFIFLYYLCHCLIVNRFS